MFTFPVVSGSNLVIANIITTRDLQVVNFRAREISRDARKLIRTSMLIKNIYIYIYIYTHTH